MQKEIQHKKIIKLKINLRNKNNSAAGYSSTVSTSKKNLKKLKQPNQICYSPLFICGQERQ